MNLASRMEQNGVPNQIQVSENTYQLLRGKYRFEHRAPIVVKGLGAVDAYLLTGRMKEPLITLNPV